jgi:AraC-like DNA-binding protein
MSEITRPETKIPPRSGNQADWPAAEAVACRVLELYVREIGPLSELAARLEISCDPSALLAGTTELEPDDLQRLYGGAVSRLSAHGQVAEGRPALKPSDWRVVLYGLDGGRTLREAIQRASDCFEAIDGRCGLMTLRVRGEAAELHFDTMRQRRTAINCLLDLSGIPQMHSQLSWLIGKPIPVLEFALAYPADVYQSLDLPPLPFALSLDGGWSGFVFPSAYLDYPLIRGAEERRSGDRPASLLFLGGGEEHSEAALAHRVRAMALRVLRTECRLPAFEEMVEQFGHSAASLRRKLVRDGHSYREIRDSCRRELGLNLLRDTSLSVEEIATRLGFCDSDAFRGAFRKWTDETPSGYRRRAQGGLADGGNAAMARLGSVDTNPL